MIDLRYHFLVSLSNLERSQSEKVPLVSWVGFGLSDASIQVGRQSVVFALPASSTDIARALNVLGQEVDTPSGAPTRVRLETSTVWAKWVELLYDLGTIGSSMRDFVPDLEIVAVKLASVGAWVWIGTPELRGRRFISFLEDDDNVGVPVDLAIDFARHNSGMVFSRVDEPVVASPADDEQL